MSVTKEAIFEWAKEHTMELGITNYPYVSVLDLTDFINSLPEIEDALPMNFNCPVCDGYITINSKGEVIA